MRCEVSAKCGGCPLIELSLTEQRDRKLERLRECLDAEGVRIERVDWMQSPRTVRYRNRIRMRVDRRGVPVFFNANKSESCPVVRSSVLDTIRSLKSALGNADLLQPVSHLEVRGCDDERASVFLVFAGAPNRQVALELRDRLTHTLVGYRGMAPSEHPHQRCRITDRTEAFVPLGSFVQVNDGVNRALVSHVVSGARERGVRSFLDLYAGSGNFALALAEAGIAGTAVELDSVAVDKMRVAARVQNLRDLEASVGESVQLASRWMELGRFADLVIIDPPRAGVRRGLIEMATCGRTHVVVCSCNPPTLSRDLAQLLRAGMTIERLTAFDMFPHTAHLEVAAWLGWA